MCGIIGFVGKNVEAAPILLDGLERMEYRGYDSAGIAVRSEEAGLQVRKSKGRLKVLRELCHDGADLCGSLGIGHTRWATHGKPSDENSHPHLSENGKFAIVHNGIIENYAELKSELIKEGFSFRSETDTEVVANLLEKNDNGDFLETVKKTVDMLQGSYAFGILRSDRPDEFVAVRHASPLIVGLGEGENFIASDVTAVLKHTRKIYRLDDGDIVLLSREGVKVFDSELNPVDKKAETITWDVKAAEKGGYDCFMNKEIHEEPTALHETISPRINERGEIVLDGVTVTKEQLKKCNKIYIVGCGSAYHVGIVGKYIIERMARIPVEVDLASEFRYREPIIDENTLMIIISQSGETADTLAALREGKRCGARIMSIVNVVGSSIANESDDVLYTWAGPEIAVATTKAYSTQLSMIYLIALYISQTMGMLSADLVAEHLEAVKSLPELVDGVIKATEPVMKKLADEFKNIEHAYYLGRNVDYAVAMEASLKLKEVSYVHSEAYAAGELKHGTISLIEPGTLVVALNCCSHIYDKTISNIEEVKSRGAKVLSITTEGNTSIEKCSDYVIYLPAVDELVLPSLEVVPMQMLGYFMATVKGFDADKPRNLAKSVTVE